MVTFSLCICIIQHLMHGDEVMFHFILNYQSTSIKMNSGAKKHHTADAAL